MSERFFDMRYGKEGDFTVTVRPRSLKVLPGKTGEHLRQANKEVLLAMRDALDWCIGRLEPGGDEPRQRKTIDVEE